MTREEAFEALFGDDSKTTATQAAVDIIKDNPMPTKAEESTLAGIDVDMLDRACTFADHPTVYVDGLPAGKDKTLLAPIAEALAKAAKSTSEPAPSTTGAPTEAPPARTDTTSTDADSSKKPSRDPLADLLAATTDATSTEPTRLLPPGARTEEPRREREDPRRERSEPRREREESRRDREESRERRDDRSDRGDGKAKKGGRRDDRDDRREPPPPPPKKPDSSVVAIVRERIILRDRAWPPMRDAILTAWAANDQAKLNKARDILRGYLEGMHGADGELLGGAMRALFQDLSAGLNTSDPAEFRHRFWG